ncbi:phenylalanine--tRNA ligase subunit beta [Chitinispirillales bacterium ANBcel5]|uniref:phenylalanine--tRNA ligase subunit beta n=1 Tax=Cellulosispirillum alkaliphilum TaxID=3039283 RepID=UPI002A51AE8C|nr:phenylalanine--tRNA ligase subunit beta [Chitinispirillales bacterium ANBcel5]
MKIVYSWLKDFVDIDVPVEDVADALTSAGIEVDSVTKVSVPKGVKVARVLSVSAHPNADKLSVCEVDDGSGESVQIVCGAPNVKAGMISALATVGTKLGDFKIKKAKIRAMESFGMLCSEQELGLSEEQSGIMSLPQEYDIGAEVSNYIPEDCIIEIEITPDRGDCLSIQGVAREVSAKFNVPLKNTAIRPNEADDEPIDRAISVEILAPQRNPRYMGRLVRNVQLGPSPDWMQRRLSLSGLRPINNVVDITNYMLIQYGQPMHAFDYDEINDKKIRVKESSTQSTFTTLDGVERKLLETDLLICDGKESVALAGIMGGAGSEIKESTKNVFLECAYFEPIGIRKTSKRLGLSTDSSYRFERGVDPSQGLVDALDTAAALMSDLAQGTVLKGVIDNYPTPMSESKITLRKSKVNKILGIDIDIDQIIKYLTSLSILCTKQDEETVECTTPLFRHDLSQEIDLVEEVGRQYGYDNIEAIECVPISLVKDTSVEEHNRDSIRYALSNFGFNELTTNSMTSEAKRKLVTPEVNPIALLNPLNPDMAELRTTMAPSLIETVGYNLNRKNNDNKFFEIGKIFENSSDISNHTERDILAIIIEGNFFSPFWNSEAKPCDFYMLKGVLETLSYNCNFGELTFSVLELPEPLYGTHSASISGNLIQGTAGRISRKVCTFFGIKSPLYYAQLDITEWINSMQPLAQYTPLPKYPSLERDFSFVMADEISSSIVAEEIKTQSPLVEKVEPFDVYRGDKLGDGFKSVTFSVSFRSGEKTLSDKDVESLCEKIIAVMKKKHGVVLRS